MDSKSDKIKELKILLTGLQKNKIKLNEVYLFGSFINDINYNDIDVAIISDNFTGIRFYDIERIIETLKRYPSNFDFHPFNTIDFYNKDNFFAQEILEKGQKIDI